MHRFLSILSAFWVGLLTVPGQSLNIAAWMVELPEANPTNRAAEFEPVLKRVAGVLKPLNADVILLHGIPDRPTARQLAGLLRPRVYQNPIFSTFRQGAQNSPIAEPPLAVLSKKQPSSARSMEWRAAGQVDSPGGFSFAVFPYGSNVLFLYTAQFPKLTPGMTPQQEAALPRKRELSARYLVSHLNWLMETSTNAAKFAYLATDLELDSATETNDPALAVLVANGFKPGSGSRTLVAAAALSSTGWPPDGALTSAFIRGAEFPGDPESIERKNFFAPVALVEVDLKPLPAAPVRATNVVAAAPLAFRPTEARIPWTDPRLIGTATAATVVLVGAMAWGLRSRRALARQALVPLMEPRPVAGRLAGRDRSHTRVPFHVMDDPDEDAVGSTADPGPGSGPVPKAGGWPFFHLLRERLVRWLAADRSQLLSSHHAGTEQVLGLEERLVKIQSQFEARLRAREQRVIELEAELLAKEKIIADLEHALAAELQRRTSPSPSPSPGS